MLKESRIDLYDYLYNLFVDTVTTNVYVVNEPQELTSSDTSQGFLVIRAGNINDESEFSRQAYGWVRCYIEAYVPPISRGRLDYERYKSFEDSINRVIELASAETAGVYHIQEESIISADTLEVSNANNAYHVFIKSFIVSIDEQED